MGLDINFYRRLRSGASVVVSDASIASTEQGFPGRTAGLASGSYDYESMGRFRAGSYSGYNDWRDWLARVAGYRSASQVWSEVDRGPFFELINFYDNEGIIGPVVSAKLAQDFASFVSRAEEMSGGGLELYRQLREAFEAAADGGFVKFC